MLTNCDAGLPLFREYALKSVWLPIIAFRNEDDEKKFEFDYSTWSILKSKLPTQVNILTMEPLTQNKDVVSVLFRLEHYYGENENAKLSASVNVNLRTLFSGKRVLEAKEMSLGGNLMKNETFGRLKWNERESNVTHEKESELFDEVRMIVHLKPMEIRTFVLKLSNN
ncbi:unnamed protein product [Didymodactylos carnosus]|uniref:Glycosyl hydrolases family 38 C-terminal domain-containing protein n=1 Tax=Didymodactylos carnosus TaxID=1234261 RepID=A0A814N384_9BILA|nr:unnamed protein product [Didymodactylos carnosus]CAF1087687.1 unnamed protein product [Didymodactylos carnosus]CAF3668687.1 unnamed protein product [Didymodactylos carnosus]CAF3853216.1 unnamed protein product [Didymodactylos carnosus]